MTSSDLSQSPWYQRSWVIIACLVFFFPVGLFLMWRFAVWNTRVKWGVTAAIVVLFTAAGIGSALGDDDPSGSADAQLGTPTDTPRTPSYTPTATLEPTHSPTPTSTPEPSETSEPTDTPEPQIERIIRHAQPGSVAEADGVQVTINQILYPWPTFEVAPGRKAIAFDVTIQNVDGGTHNAEVFRFKLRDSEDFEYECFGCAGSIAFVVSPEPALQSIGLGSGGRTRGWVAFEIVESAHPRLLKYDPQLFSTSDIEFHFDY